MNEFKESLKVERKNSGEIIITEQLKSLLIELMKGNISKKELMEMTGIGDKVSVETKITEIVAEDNKYGFSVSTSSACAEYYDEITEHLSNELIEYVDNKLENKK